MKIPSLIREPDGEKVSRTRKTVSLTIANLTNTVLSVLFSMIAARVLTKTDIAIESQTFLAYTTFSPLLSLGMNQGIYYWLAKNEHRKRAVVKECINVATIMAIGYSAFILLGGNTLLARFFKNDGITVLLYWMIPYSIFLTPATIVDCVFVFENRIRFNALYNAIKTFISLILLTTVLMICKTASSVVITKVICTLFFSVFTFFIAFSFVITKDDGRMTILSIKGIISISTPLCISSLVGTISVNLDKWIISSMLSPEDYAIYTRGAHELPLIGTLLTAISTVIIVDMTRAVKNGDYNLALSLFRKCAKKTSFILFPIACFLAVSAESFITTLYSSAYVEAVPIFRIYLLYVPIRTVFYGPLLIALGKTKEILYKTIAGLVANAVLSYFLVLSIGKVGAALATIVSLYFVNIPINLYLISKGLGVKRRDILPLKAFRKNIITSIPGAAVVMIIDMMLLGSMTPIVRLIIEALTYCSITALVLRIAYNYSLSDLVRYGRSIIKK